MNAAGDNIGNADIIQQPQQQQQQQACLPDDEQKQLQTYLNVLLHELEICKEKIKELTVSLNNSISLNKTYADEINCLKNSLACAASVDQVAGNKAPRKIARKNIISEVCNKDAANSEPCYGEHANSSACNLMSVNEIGVANNSTSDDVPHHSGHTILANAASTGAIPKANQLNGFTTVTGKPKKKVIQAIDTNLNLVRRSIKDVNGKNFFLKQSSSKAPVKISIQHPEEIPVIRSALKKSNISFHEYKWESEKNKCFVIRGLVGVTDEDVPGILQELFDSGVPKNSTLSLYVTGYMRANPSLIHNSLLKLVVPPEFDAEVLKSIKFIDHVAVSFEKLQSKSVVQCKNCQRFGHSAAGCQHVHRCVKCGSNHLRNDCPRTFNKAVKLICCNCGGEHSANNLSMCSFFLNNFAKKSVSAVVNATNGSALSSRPSAIPSAPGSKKSSVRSPSVSYAAVVGTTQHSPAKHVGYGSAVPQSRNFIQQDDDRLSALANKVDVILQLVTKHEALLQRICSHD